MDDLINDIRSKIIKSVSADEKPFFLRKGFKGISISENSFHEISLSHARKTLAFIDGGNSEVIGGSNFSLQYIRTAAATYRENSKEWAEKEEFYCLISFNDGKFTAKNISSGHEISFEADDESLREGKSIISISKLGNFMRRLAEIRMAEKAMNKSDIIILDGTLEEKFLQEKEALKNLYEKSRKANVLLSALSKTNSLVTSNGNSFSAVLEEMKRGKWYYHPVADIENEDFKGDVCFVRLHENSEHVFRLDLHSGSFGEVCATLAENSRDPVFLGYPYGLIEADRIARVSNKEAVYLRTKLAVKLGDDWKRIRKLNMTKNAHEILDSIS